jgi:excisionase family DNA binding protein
MSKEKEMSAIEAARRLAVGLDYVYSLIWTGKLDGRKVDQRWLVSMASVREASEGKGGSKWNRWPLICARRPGLRP